MVETTIGIDIPMHTPIKTLAICAVALLLAGCCNQVNRLVANRTYEAFEDDLKLK